MNVELALAALADAKANPDRFDMDFYWNSPQDFTKDTQDMTVPPCGTTGCFAGFAALRAAPVGTKILAAGFDYVSRIVQPGQDPEEALSTGEYAMKALDITEDQAATLFHLDNIRQVETAIRYLVDSPGAFGETLWGIANPDPE